MATPGRVSIIGRCCANAQRASVWEVSYKRRRRWRIVGVRSWTQTEGFARRAPQRRNDMSVARITEISSISNKSFEDAVVQGIERANQTLKNVKGAWVKDQEVRVENGKVSGYKVILKVTFVLE
jgi:dodecin